MNKEKRTGLVSQILKCIHGRKPGRLMCMLLLGVSTYTAGQSLEPFNLHFTTQGKGSEASMILGNGDITANAWVDRQDHHLYFYIGKSDTHNDQDQLYKVGKIKVGFYPNILVEDKDYVETFRIADATYRIKTKYATLTLRVDANNPVILLDAKTTIPAKMTVTAQLMRPPRSGAPDEACDRLVKGRSSDLLFYYRNRSTAFFDENMRVLHLDGLQINNPQKNKTFGALATGSGLHALQDSMLVSAAARKAFNLKIAVLTAQTATEQQWIDSMQRMAGKTDRIPGGQMWRKHQQYWSAFWNRSFINVSSTTVEKDTLQAVTKSYLYQRYILGICGRGNFMMQFNGASIVNDTYTHPLKTAINTVSGKSADYRNWSPVLLWQNQRLPYLPLLASGDWELIQPMIRYYTEVVYPVDKLITKRNKHQPGVAFEESATTYGAILMNVFGNEQERRERKLTDPKDFKMPHLQDHIVCGPELVSYFLDYYSYTQDENFLLEKLLPIARDVVLYFDKAFPRDSAGKLVIKDFKVLETYPHATNPIVLIGGLKYILPRLAQLKQADQDFKDQCTRLLQELPGFYTYHEGGLSILKPAQQITIHQNVEYPELYVVFPFRIFGIGKPNIDLALHTFNTPSYFGTKNISGYESRSYISLPNGLRRRMISSWHTTGIQASLLGLKEEAAFIVKRNFLLNDKGVRFPCFYSKVAFDYPPDIQHGAIAMTTLQTMLLQSEDDRILLFPSWKKEWNVHFKLKAAKNTTIECELINGRVKKLKVTPANRAADVVNLLK
ncbi:DUF5703 domain-containing protein [Niabella hirudinis]|uniref:DUF5703 domain-containing protein n=1 Tax=Niabella hirudinis TaxID=1285929 RepID=UPI003EBA9B0B